MQSEGRIPNRKSLRLPHYDCSTPGMYFVTVCVAKGKNLFGQIIGQEMSHNSAGNAVNYWWNELPKKFLPVNVDASVVMPNHFHVIISITDVGADLCVRPGSAPIGRSHRSAPTLGDIMKWFKTMTTNAYITGVKEKDWKQFKDSLCSGVIMSASFGMKKS